MFAVRSLLLASIAVAVLSQEYCDSNCCPKNWLGYNGFCYRHFNFRKSWDEAQNHCLHDGANLASIHSASENAIINAYLRGEEVWIGLNDLDTESEYIWSDGTPVDYINWHHDQPNDSDGQDCGQINYSTHANETWNDYSCESLLGFICKK